MLLITSFLNMLRLNGNPAASGRSHIGFLRIAMCVCLFSSTSQIAYPSEKMTESEAWKERHACGARASFALMRLLGKEAKYETIYDHFTFSENGSSLDDVQSALSAHNVPCSILRLQLTDLSSVPTPFIAHVSRSREGGLDKGHYLIVAEVDANGVQTYDPVLNQERYLPWRLFSDRWYGYVIVPTHSTIWSSQNIMLCVLGIHVLVAVGVIVTLGRSLWTKHIKWTNRRSFPATLFLVAMGLLHSSSAMADEIVRSYQHDGANAAALLGGVYGVEIPPGDVGETGPVDSITKIQTRLEEYGVDASVRFLGYDQLASLNRVCVVPLRTSHKENATFCVFVHSTDSDVYLVDAGPLMVRRLPIDDFRRYWTGYAVYGDVSHAGSFHLLGWALSGLGLPLSGYAIISFVRKQAWHRYLSVQS